MQLQKLNIKSDDVDINNKSVRIYLKDYTFENGNIDTLLTKKNVRDINEGKRFINVKPEQFVKSGGAIPLLALIPAMAALFGGVATGASSIATAVHTKKKLDKELEELKLHNKESETGSGYVLNSSTYKRKDGSGYVLNSPTYKRKEGSGYALKKKVYS
jgi:hypothetical protein